MCSPAVRLRGSDRWPFWLALGVSQQHPIPLVRMVVHGRAKSNSSSAQGPNKITDLKLRGHAWRFCLHLSALLISLEKREKNETVRRGEGREMKRLNKIRICMKGMLHLRTFTLYFCSICIFLTPLLLLSSNVHCVLHCSLQKLPVSQTQVGGTVMCFSSDLLRVSVGGAVFVFSSVLPHRELFLPTTAFFYSKQTALAAARNVKFMTSCASNEFFFFLFFRKGVGGSSLSWA